MVAMQQGRVKRVLTVTSPEDAAEAVKPYADCDVFFAPAGFDGDTRKADLAAGAGAFWLDVDCGDGKPYATQAEGAKAISAWVTKRQMPAPSIIVSSGYGLHVYWLLQQSYGREPWLSVARKLKATCAVDNFAVDPVRTADIASILRVPGTMNLKRGGVPCTTLFDSDVRYTLHDIEKSLPALGPQGVVRPALPIPNDDDDQDYPPGDASAVVAGCQQIRNSWGKDNTPEPLWRAALSVLSRCVGGEKLIHAYSKGDPRYTASATADKARRTQGPQSCAQFEAACPGGCAGCINNGQVRTPIQLKPAPVNLKPEWPFNKVAKFVLTNNGITVINDEGEVERICSTPVWVSAYRMAMRSPDERPYAEVEISYWRSDGSKDVAVMDVGVLADGKKFEQEIRHMSLTGVYKFPPLKNFLSSYMDEHVEKIGTEMAVRRLGWCEQGFCVGNRIITAKGVQNSKVLANSTVFKNFKPSGTLEGWKAAVAVLNDRQDYMPLKAAILAGFGSAILELADVQGASLILTGESGGGKTTAAKAALSIYGPPTPLTQDAKQMTVKGIGMVFSTARNVPVLVDEIGPIVSNADKLGSLIYLASNGTGGASLNRSREIRDMGSWSLQPMMTSNVAVLDLGQADLLNAHRYRIVELPVFRAMDSTDGAKLAKAADNVGQACVPYLTALCQVRDKVPAQFEAAVKAINERYKLPSAGRFCSWSLAAAQMGGAIAKQVGLLTWDIQDIIDYMAGCVTLQAGQVMETQDQIEDFVPEWLRQNVEHVLDMRNGTDMALMPANRAPMAALHKDKIILSQVDLFEHAKEMNVSQAAVVKWVTSKGGSQRRAQMSHTTPMVKAFVLPANAIQFGEGK